MTVPSEATVERWTLYTMSGIAGTDLYRWHPSPPTDDPTVIGLNVPTRVANYVACGWDTGHLSDPDNWSLDIDWEER
jgi:hypothetical protein